MLYPSILCHTHTRIIVQLSAKAVERVKTSREVVDDIVHSGKSKCMTIQAILASYTYDMTFSITSSAVYGINTGFGALGNHTIPPRHLE